MTQNRRSVYKMATNYTQSRPASPHHEDCLEQEAAGGNGGGPLARMGAGASPSMALATRVVEGFARGLVEIVSQRPSMAAPLIRGEKSHCFHCQPIRAISGSTMQTASKPVPISLIPCTYKVDAVISRTPLTTSLAASTPIASYRQRGYCQLLFTFSLVASICIIGAQCAPTTIKVTPGGQVASMQPELASGGDGQQAEAHTANSKPAPMVVIELSANGLPQEDKESQVSNDDTILLVLTDSQDNPSASSIRRLIKRSGISDQRLAEIQMIRALKKQLERASKLATSNLNPAGQEETSSS